jgi:multiple sugar transport system permease protein
MRRNLEGWLFASPWIIGFVLFTVGPMLASAVMAFMKWDLLSAPSFTGLDNFKQALWGDPLVWLSLRVTTAYAIVSVPLNLVLGLGLALLLNSGIRGLRFYRTAYFLPSVLSGWRLRCSGAGSLRTSSDSPTRCSRTSGLEAPTGLATVPGRCRR